MPEAIGRDHLRLVLMGTGPFAVPSFDAIADRGIDIATVITRPERPSRSRRPAPPSPVRQWAESRRLPVEAPENINADEAINALRARHPHLLVVCDYGQILSPPCLSVATLGGINLHGSLLPRYRGAAPVQWAILNGDRETGVSVIHMTPKLDGGPIIATRRTPVDRDENAEELETRLAALGVEATLEAIDLLAAWDQNSPIGVPQDPAQVSKAPRLSKRDGRIDWARTAEQIRCHLRGMTPWPGAFTEYTAPNGKPIRLALRAATVAADRVDSATPGTVIENEGKLLVATGGGILRIDRLQPAGKKEMSATDYLRGNPLPTGTLLQ